MFIWTKIGQIHKGDESANMDMDQEGATLKNRGGSNSWTREAHK